MIPHGEPLVPLDENTQKYLSDFADYCRKGAGALVPGLRKDRADEYRRLTLNIIDDTLQSTYPVLRSILSATEWSQLVEGFFGSRSLGDPELWRMPKQLLEYARENQIGEQLDRPYLNDLLLLEWTETEVFMMPDVPSISGAVPGDVWSQPIVLNPEFKISRFEYPVFKVPASELIAAKGEYFLLTFRNPDTFHVQFVELSRLFVEFIQILASEQISGALALNRACSIQKCKEDADTTMATKSLLTSLVDLRMVLGVLAPVGIAAND